MKAIAFAKRGGPDVLQLMEFPEPHAGPGEVRVRVKTAGVQPFDIAVRRGWTPPGAAVRLPQIVGNEFAGVVDEVGEDVSAFKVGDEVLGWALLAACAEYVVVNAGQIVRKPRAMGWEEAGALVASGQTAHTALDQLRVSPGEVVLIHAAAGGVGTMAVQLAIARRAKVIGTASPQNHEYLRSLGATPVAYGNGLVERVRAVVSAGIDAVLDAIGGDALHASIELGVERDRIGTIAGFDLVEALGIRPIRSERSIHRLRALVELYEQGELRVHIRQAFPLHRASDAHRAVEGGHGRGKVVIVMTVAD